MADKKKMYEIVDFILNQADDSELEVVREALKRRIEHKSRSPGGIDMNYLAHKMGDTVEKQVSSSKDYIKQTVQDFIIKTLREQAPEISDKELQVMLSEFMPSEARKKTPGREKAAGKKKLPPDVEIKMIDQFMRFSAGSMSLDEQAAIRKEIPDWQEAYWKSFSEKVRKLIALYLKGKIDSASCWEEIKKELFNE